MPRVRTLGRNKASGALGCWGRDSSTGAQLQPQILLFSNELTNSSKPRGGVGGLYMDTDGEELHRLRFVQLLYRRNKMNQITK